MERVWLNAAKGVALGLLGFVAGVVAIDIYRGDSPAMHVLSKTPFKALAAREENQQACLVPSSKEDYIYFVSCGGFF